MRLRQLLRRAEPGATAGEVEEIERDVGRRIPPDLKALWRRVGGGWFVPRARVTASDGTLVSLHTLWSVRPALCDDTIPYRGFAARYLHRKNVPDGLFPFAGTEGGDLICVTEEGRVVVLFDESEPQMVEVRPSIDAMFNDVGEGE